MEDLRFYDYEFNLRHIEPLAESVNWQMYYNGIGQFEAYFSYDSDVVALLTSEPYLVVVQGERQALITGFCAGKNFAVFGRTVNWLLQKRLVAPFESCTGKAEELARGWVQTAFSDVENFVCEESGEIAEEITISQDIYKPLSEVLTNALSGVHLGHDLIFDVLGKCWRYQTKKGKERLLTVSEDEHNAYDTSASFDFLDLSNSGWFEEKVNGESEWRFVDNGEKTGIYRWESILNAQTDEEALSELSKSEKGVGLTAKMSGLQYRSDYELGDVVTVKIAKGALLETAKMRIIGIHLWYEEGLCGEQPMMEEVEDELRI
ncbi:MAG: hypothetical protein IJA08_04105 [Clostridia bacterium]|nr:hypothetical protein [Clostridia bacterium]